MLNDEAFLVLNTVYLKKMASRRDIADIAGLPVSEVEQQTNRFVDAEALMETPSGMMLLTPGTEAVLDYYRTTYEPIRQSEFAARWYERFETVNTRFIALVSEWQKTESDKVKERVFQQVDKLCKLLGELLGQIPRYGQYITRFERGMSLVDQGQKQYLCKPTLDSIHNVWFEFHEDILAVLGRPRDTT